MLFDSGTTLQKDRRMLLEASYMTLEQAREHVKPRYRLDVRLSSDEDKVLVHIASGRPLVLFRGSVSFADWAVSDVLLALGFSVYDPRHQRARKLVEIVRRKYGVTSAMGHSLGGHLAENSGAAQVHTSQKGAGLKDIGKVLPKTQFDVRSPGDIVSALSLTQRGGSRKTVGRISADAFTRPIRFLREQHRLA